MPEYDDYDEDIEENDDAQEDAKFARVPRSAIKRLEKKAARADEAERKLGEYERQDAFRAVGLDPSDPKAKYFVKGYEGDLSIDAIKAAAIEAGYLEPEKPPVEDAELAEHANLGNAAAGSVGNTSTGQEAAYQQELAAAKNPDEAMAVMAKYGKPVASHS